MASLSIQRALYPVLYPLGRMYASLMATRRRRYESGAKECFTPKAPCVAVGNISWGGSGKTPVVSWLLDWAEQTGKQAVVLTRGYKATPPVLPCLVTAASTPLEAGDEPVMLAKEHPAARIVVDPVRKRSGAWAEEQFSPDIAILDDGFQHLAVTRDCNLVLLKPDDLTSEWDRVIPSGSWREGKEALRRADAFLIKTETLQLLEADICRRLELLGVPVFSFSLAPEKLVPVTTTAKNHLKDMGYERASATVKAGYSLFSGVGEPEQVENTAQQFLENTPQQHHRFADHHGYTRADIQTMGASGLPLVCTPKDAVKVPDVSGVAIWTFQLRTRFNDAMFTDKSFETWWQERWESLSRGDA